MIKNLTIVMPYYEAPEMLKVHLNWWKNEEFDNNLSVILVDDGSVKYPAHELIFEYGVPGNVDLSLFQIKKNILWNHAAARNLGMNKVSTRWAFLTDIDHVLYPWAACQLMEQDLDPHFVYQPPRYELGEDGMPHLINKHSDTYIITYDLFWEIGGYDETFAGYWNGSFEPFRKALKRKTTILDLNVGHTLRYNNYTVPDANTDLGRKGSEFDINCNPDMKALQREAMKKYKPVTLQQEYEMIL